MHEHYPDGGQSIRWLSDEEFPPYGDNSSVEEDLHIGGPSCTGRAARKSLSASRHLTIMHHLQAKDTTVDDEPASVMHCKEGTPEV